MTSKIITYQQAAGFGQKRIFDSGTRCIFKTGCFDILHLGHIKTFEQAKTTADILIVGVGSDAFITQYKRAPLFNQQTRAEWVAAIGCVDYVVILEEGPEHWQGTIDHVKFLTDVRPHFYFLPHDDKSLQLKKELAARLGIAVKIQEPADDFYITSNGQKVKISSSFIKKQTMKPATAPKIADSIESYYPKEFSILKEKGRLVDDWANVYQHCKKEAEAAWAMSVLLHLTPDDLDVLVSAAILHDWYKRNEREAANAAGGSPEKYNEAVNLSRQGLLDMGYSDRIVDIAHSVGHTAIKEVAGSKDLLKKLMFFIDNIVNGDQLQTIDERMDALEAAPRYKELNESGRAIHDGQTYFEAQRKLSHSIQSEIEQRAGIGIGQLIDKLKEILATEL